MKRIPLLIGALLLVALTDGKPVSFIQPKSAVILASPYGAEIPLQVRIEPSPLNRGYRIDWDGGASARSLNGDEEPALQPPLTIRVFQSQTIVARVFGEGGKQIARAEFNLKVCGGSEECQ